MTALVALLGVLLGAAAMVAGVLLAFGVFAGGIALIVAGASVAAACLLIDTDTEPTRSKG